MSEVEGGYGPCQFCGKFVRHHQTYAREDERWCQCGPSEMKSLNQEAIELILDNLIERLERIERFLQL